MPHIRSALIKAYSFFKYFGEHHAFFVRNLVQLMGQCNAVVMRTVFFLLGATNCHVSSRHRKHFFSPQINFHTWFHYTSNHPEDSLFSLAAAQALAFGAEGIDCYIFCAHCSIKRKQYKKQIAIVSFL